MNRKQNVLSKMIVRPSSIGLKVRSFALILVFSFGVAGEVSAQSFWNGVVGSNTNLWSTAASWSPAAVPNSSGAIVTFSKDFTGTATDVSVAGNTYTVGVINMTDTSTGTAGKFNITSSTGGTLTLNNGASIPVINYTTGGQFDNFINVVLAGSNGLEKTGSGTAQISGFDNTYTGITKITAGGLRIAKNSNLGSASSGSELQLNGGTLFVRGNNTFALDNRVAFADAPGSARRNVTVTAGTSSAPTQLQVESGSTLEVSGNLTSIANTFFRKTDTGSLILSGSANNMIGTTEFNQGTVNITGGFNSTNSVVIAKANTASLSSTLNWSGNGTVARGASQSLIINDGGTSVSSATLNVTAGTLDVGTGSTSGSFIVGGKGGGTANISGGTLSVKGAKDVSVGSFFKFGGGGGNGTLTISGTGLLQALSSGNFSVGYGQALTATDGGAFGGIGVLNLNGGTLETGRTIRTGENATGTFNFNGGILKSAANNANWLAVTSAKIKNGGAIINSAGFSNSISQNLIEDSASTGGGLLKTGAGTLELKGINTYTGGTTVSDGSLLVNNTTGSGTGTSTVSVSTGATLGGSGIISGATTISGTLRPGNSPGVLTFGSDLTLNTGGNMVWELWGNSVVNSPVTYDQTVVGGNLNVAGTFGITLDFGTLAGGSAVNWADSFWISQNSWVLFDVTGSTSGAQNLSLLNSVYNDANGVSLATARSGASFSIAQVGSDVVVNYVPEPSPTSLILIGLGALAAVRTFRRRA